MQDHISAREEAEDAAMAAPAQLPIADAMEASVRLQAAMLAGLGIVPGTAEFERIAIAWLALLAERTEEMHRAARATAH